jgi:large subunit ribosomal protein L3
MTQIFDEKGTVIPVTLIEAGPCPVIHKKTDEKDGYLAVQIGFDPKPARLVNKPDSGHFAKAEVDPVRVIREFRGEDTGEIEVGETLSIEIFDEGEHVDVIGKSKGRGFAGPRRRHGVSPGPKSHGSMYHNRPGSMGGSSDPSRVFKGKKLAGQTGNERVTTKNLIIVKKDAGRNLLFVKGSVPGANNGYVLIRKRKSK